MASKKLKVEVELETAKAKRQAKELEQSGGGSATGAGGIASTSKKLRELGDSANKASINMRNAAKALTGIAVGLAGSYAAGHMKEGSTGRVALEYGSTAVSGASMGAMIAGPIGAAIGGLAGTLKTYLDRSAANQGAIADYQKGEETYAKTREWSKHVKSITGIGEIKDYDFIKNDGERLAAEMKDVAEHLEKTKFHIRVLNNAIPAVQTSIKRMQEAGDTDTEEYKKLIEELQEHRSKLAALESAEESLTKQEHNLKVEEGRIEVNDRPGFSAPDALSRIGGMFAGNDGMSEQKRANAIAEEQLTVLKDIKAAKGGKF